MIHRLVVRDLHPRLDEKGITLDIWDGGDFPAPHIASCCRLVFPGVVEAWMRREAAWERIVCLQGMLKLVLCDRREGSPTRDEVSELFLGEYRWREVVVPPGVLRGWKAMGGGPALALVSLQGESGEGVLLTQEEAGVPYDWEIVMR